MYRFILGFMGGVYIGNKYNVNPFLSQVESFIKKNFPTKD